MSEYLPHDWFKWLKNVDVFDVISTGKESNSKFRQQN